MIKIRADARLFPCSGCVTCLAGLLKRALVWVAMATGARIEKKPGVTRLPIRSRRVALLAIDCAMRSCQRVTRL